MTNPVQLALMVTPLAVYLYLLAVWQAGRHPRVVTGSRDVWLLALGLGGLVLLGPLGDWLEGMLSSSPRLLHRALLALVATLVVSRLALRSGARLVIYHVDGATIHAALTESLGAERFSRTLGGYEDRAGALGVRVEHSPRWQWAVVDGFGAGADRLIADLEPKLRARFRNETATPSEVSLLFFALSALTMLIPLAGHLLTQPRTRAALRVLLERLHGG
jgi:hypothetical protein